MGLFSKSRVPPPKVPTDEVIPLRFMDNLGFTRGICNEFSYCFDDVLDVDKLQRALTKLVHKEGWRKLGARLRCTDDGKLEYHVPQEFSEKRPAVLYSHTNYATPIADHPVLSKLPKGTGTKPAVMQPSWYFRPHMRGPNQPQYLDDWLYADIPQMAINIVSFTDATIITISYMHTLMDGVGLTSVLQGWSTVLKGEDDSLPPFVGYYNTDDPQKALHQHKPGSEFILANKVVKGWSLLVYIVRQTLQHLWWPKNEARIVCVPGDFVKRLVKIARAEIDLAYIKAGEKGSKPFAGESDVFLAWWIRTLVRAHNHSPSRTIALHNAYNSRSFLAEMGLIPRPDAAFIGNAGYMSLTLAPARDYLSTTTPLGLLSTRIRHALLTQRTLEQFHAQHASMVESVAATGHPPLFGDSSMSFYVYSNMKVCNQYELDFSPAVISPEVDSPATLSKAYRRGTPTFINSTSTEVGLSPRGTGLIVGKDKAGCWWLMGNLRKGVWKKVEQELLKSEEA